MRAYAQMHAAQNYRSAEGKKVSPKNKKFERYTWVQDAMWKQCTE